MYAFLIPLLAGLGSTLRTRTSLHVEILALRHQRAVLERSKRRRVPLRAMDRLLWVALCRLWPDWRKAIVLVKPETVIAWHRKGFRLYWRWKSCSKFGAKTRSAQRRALPKDFSVLCLAMSALNDF